MASMILRKNNFENVRIIITTACICILVTLDELLGEIVYYTFRINIREGIAWWAIVSIKNMVFFLYPINTRWLPDLIEIGGIHYVNVALVQEIIGVMTFVGLKVVKEYLCKNIDQENSYQKPKNEYILQLITIGIMIEMI